MKRNPKSPWNPSESCNITPEEFEIQVLSWLRRLGKIDSFSAEHLRHLAGSGGNYEFDGVIEFDIFGSSIIIILIECKRYSHPVEREEINSLYSKLQDVGAHKAMIFSTSGFQSGALSYAKNKGIACITVVNGEYLYETRDAGGNHKPPPWVNLPKYAGILLEEQNNSIQCNSIDKLKDWLK